ncbi:MAG TPA: alpha/beta hydrolase [Thermoanaerobaculia bacterium]|nr:alpha/beta hydrolase [Thermoanaerobaculia bacterium]
MHTRTSGSGPPVLFLHGYPTSGRLWDPVVERFAPRFTCIAPDLPGLGASPPLPGPPDPENMARAVEALRTDLGLPAWSVVGHDAGAVVAVHFAARFPDRVTKLALLSPPIFPELRPPWFFRLLRTPGLGDLAAPLVALAIRRGGLRSRIESADPALDGILEDFHRPFRGLSGARRLLRLVRWGDPKEVLARTADLLPGIETPTLILHGRRDGAVPPSFATRAAAATPGARALLLDAGHFLPLDAPETLCEALEVFLAGGPSASP